MAKINSTNELMNCTVFLKQDKLHLKNTRFIKHILINITSSDHSELRIQPKTSKSTCCHPKNAFTYFRNLNNNDYFSFTSYFRHRLYADSLFIPLWFYCLLFWVYFYNCCLPYCFDLMHLDFMSLEKVYLDK